MSFRAGEKKKNLGIYHGNKPACTMRMRLREGGTRWRSGGLARATVEIDLAREWGARQRRGKKWTTFAAEMGAREGDEECLKRRVGLPLKASANGLQRTGQRNVPSYSAHFQFFF